MSKIQIDYIDNIYFDTNSPIVKNFHSIDIIKDGLIFLYSNVKNEENKRNLTNLKNCFQPWISDENTSIITNSFDWFSINLVNYVRLIALIDKCNKKKWNVTDLVSNKDEIKKYSNNYIKRIIPEISLYRRKVSGHPALCDPMNENIALLEYTVMLRISWKKQRFYTGSFDWCKGDIKSGLKEWSLTEKFEKLKERFWPDMNM